MVIINCLFYLCGSRPRLTMLCDRLDLCRVSKCRSLDFRFELEASFTHSNDNIRQPMRYRPAQRRTLEIDMFEASKNYHFWVLFHFIYSIYKAFSSISINDVLSHRQVHFSHHFIMALSIQLEILNFFDKFSVLVQPSQKIS